MKTTLQLVLLLAVVGGAGDLLLRQLPERILADLNQRTARVAAQRLAAPAGAYVASSTPNFGPRIASDARFVRAVL